MTAFYTKSQWDFLLEARAAANQGQEGAELDLVLCDDGIYRSPGERDSWLQTQSKLTHENN